MDNDNLAYHAYVYNIILQGDSGWKEYIMVASE